MNINDYLNAAEECLESEAHTDASSISKVKTQFGIYDNYRILLKGPSTEIRDILKKSKKFSFNKTFDGGSGETHHFNYMPGIIKAQLCDGIWYYEWEDQYDEVKENFGSTITLHPYQKKDMSDITYDEAKALGTRKSSTAIIRAIRDLTDYLVQNNISFCIPDSSKNYSDMVKFYPSEK